MKTILPVISMTDLQRDAKKKLESIEDYAVVQRHGRDVAFVLSPELGRALITSGFLDVLRAKSTGANGASSEASPSKTPPELEQLDHLIGQVLRELSKK